ncbi:DUF3293 domain-containing protein [Thalassomonas sp. M1454]|uniref:DUF3293 domain-containing protein n=1 Tax=Thalassomonas sp. M1454 TaxID=2594477 RepID=UPI00117FC186|nr:DUF3293 domain-containing protein [Thalassomonas sp. M1454]TRX56675.1 DUF3293 domain-containing protein [Thalassomonas sp. M1454]
MDKNLQQAYLNSDYIIDDELGFWQINIGDTDRTLSRYLHTFDVPTAAFITAENPKSKRLSDKENKKRGQQLLSQVQKLKLTCHQGYSIGAKADWPKENSLLITNITKQQANSLAQQFNQNAYVWLDETGAVKLIELA